MTGNCCDAAALAAAAALVQPTAGARQSTATTLAGNFSTPNTVVNGTVNPANTLTPMTYNLTTGAITTAPDWSPGPTGLNCNAVQVSTTVPTPMFFSAIRGAFGSGGSSSVAQAVSAVAHLPCPGVLNTNTAQGISPLALKECRWTFPQSCDSVQRLFQAQGQSDNSEWVTYNLGSNAPNCSDIADGTLPTGLVATVKVGDTVNVNNGQITPCLRTLRDTYGTCTPARCAQEPSDPACTVIAPIVDCAGSASSGTVVGFASICFSGFDTGNAPKWVDGSIECGEVAPSSAGGNGICLGTYASNPILVR